MYEMYMCVDAREGGVGARNEGMRVLSSNGRRV